VVSLGGSENATKLSIFKPSGFTWRLGKCDQVISSALFTACQRGETPPGLALPRHKVSSMPLPEAVPA
jgi:hypothetical protein